MDQPSHVGYAAARKAGIAGQQCQTQSNTLHAWEAGQLPLLGTSGIKSSTKANHLPPRTETSYPPQPPPPVQQSSPGEKESLSFEAQLQTRQASHIPGEAFITELADQSWTDPESRRGLAKGAASPCCPTASPHPPPRQAPCAHQLSAHQCNTNLVHPA